MLVVSTIFGREETLRRWRRDTGLLRIFVPIALLANLCRRMCLRGTLALVIALGAGHGATAETPRFIHAEGTRLVEDHGARFVVKGINLGNWLVPEGYMFRFTRARAPNEIAAVIGQLIGPEAAARFWSEFRDRYIAKDDIDFIRDAGFNTVRVPLHWRLFVDPGEDGADRFDGPGWMLLDRLIAWCHQTGLHVIIDLHAAPGGQTGVNHDDGPGFPLTFYVPHDRRLTVALWRALAARYHDEPAVLGYDLMNEPISPYSDEAFLNPRLEPFYRQIVDAIRSVDVKHPVILAGAQWSTSFAVFGPPFDANAIYTYHKFWATPTRDTLQAYLNFSNRWNVPLLIGETGEYNDDWNEKYRLLHERFGIGWCFWPYKSLDTETSVVSVGKPDGWDLIAEAGGDHPGPLPPRAQAQAILDAYLEAIRFRNTRVNAGYLKSLGLAAP